MSTPTPSSHPHQPGAKHPTYANHAVSTPAAHLTTPSSSTPRSVPSPAVLRNTAGKTPMTGNASKLSVDSRGAVLMAPSLSQMSTGSGMSGTVGGNNAGVGLGVMGAGGMMGLGTSPAVNMLGFASPAALGALDLSTPAMLDAAAAAGAQGMNVSLSDLGISGAKRNEDEERRARLEGVLGKIQGKRKRVGGMGRLSEEGVRRVGKWAGFAEDVDPKTEGPEFEGERTITMAGSSALLIDVSASALFPARKDWGRRLSSRSETRLQKQAVDHHDMLTVPVHIQRQSPSHHQCVVFEREQGSHCLRASCSQGTPTRFDTFTRNPSDQHQARSIRRKPRDPGGP